VLLLLTGIFWPRSPACGSLSGTAMTMRRIAKNLFQIMAAHANDDIPQQVVGCIAIVAGPPTSDG
jgi:hypothetical protein